MVVKTKTVGGGGVGRGTSQAWLLPSVKLNLEITAAICPRRRRADFLSLVHPLLFTLRTFLLGRVSDLLPLAVAPLPSARCAAPLPLLWPSETLIPSAAQISSPKSLSSALPSSDRRRMGYFLVGSC